MKHYFRPFNAVEADLLSIATGIDYRRTDFSNPRWLCVSGRDDFAQLMGMCCFEFVSPFEAYFNIAVVDSRCITRRVMRAMFQAVFSQAVRVSAEIRPDQERTIQLAQRMGFEIEGFKRLAIEGRWDALMLGMTKDTCRWLRRAPRGSQAVSDEVYHGQHSQSA